MNDWSQGYVTEFDYTFSYYQELNPLRCLLPLTRAGIQTPAAFENACELGFGQGVSINLHAAGSNTRWYGTDFNPSQAQFAQALATASGAACYVYDQSFEQFCSRSDLPEFDFICLHGIWSWISQANQAVIVDFVARKLKVGGIVYISYNTLPGWAQMLPVRELLVAHAQGMSAPFSPMPKRIDDAFGFMETLFALQPSLKTAAPLMAQRFERMSKMDRHYLAHEYFNQDWSPMPFHGIARMLGEAKLSFAGSANYTDYVDAVNFTPEQLALLNGLNDPVFKESVRDFLTGQSFRRDYWVKGPVMLSASEQADRLRSLFFVLITRKADVNLGIKGLRGEGQLDAGTYKALFEAMNDDHAPFSLAELESKLAGRLTLGQISQACLCLVAKGNMLPAQAPSHVPERLREQTRRLNEAVIRQSHGRPDLNVLASPILAGGLQSNRFHQMFVGAMLKGFRDTADIARDVLQQMRVVGQQVLKDGQPIANDELALKEIGQEVEAFKNRQGKVMKALQVV